MSHTTTLYDADGQKLKTIHTDVDGKTTFWTEQNVDAIIAQAARDAENEKSFAADVRTLAHVPDGIVDQAMREGWYHDSNAWKRWLNDPQNKPFRVWKGRV